MSFGLQRKSIQLNPELEALRAKGLQENVLQSDDWILRMIGRTSHIHAGFLFEDRKTLQNICLFVSETQNKITDAGWEALGYHLGLSPSVLKVINYNNFNKEDPCYNTLLAYVQYENSSIGKILEALYVMGRIDVLSRVQESVNDLADIILNTQYNSSNNAVEDTSDYGSLGAIEGSNSHSNISTSNDSMIKPKVIPPAPFIFQNLKAYPELTSRQIQQVLCNELVNNSFSNYGKNTYNNVDNVSEKLTYVESITQEFRTKYIRENLQNSSCPSDKENFRVATKQKYGMKILLTFAEDGEKYVEKICNVFRKKREGYPSIGVLVLSEHSEIVNKDPQQFISGAFYQVNYVCPILTTGYFNLITKKQKATSLSNIHLDSFYVPYIYRLMNSYFVANDCLNDKVRCIVPESEFSSTKFDFMMTNPLFGAWVKLSEIDEMTERLLKSSIKKSF